MHRRRRLLRVAQSLALLISAQPAQAVVCGEEIAPGKQPWLVRVVGLKADGGQLYGDNEATCTGALVDESFVITAAHCVKQIGVAQDRGNRIGVRFWTGAGMSKPYPVAVGNPVSGGAVDIVLLRVIDEAKAARPITPADPDGRPATGSQAHIGGWGAVWPVASAVGGVRSMPHCTEGTSPAHSIDRPRQAQVTLLEQRACGIKQGDTAKPLPEPMICAHGTAPVAAGICSGDSGGPLIAATADGQMRLIGVASRVPGIRHADPQSCTQRPGLFSSVSEIGGAIAEAIAALGAASKKLAEK